MKLKNAIISMLFMLIPPAIWAEAAGVKNVGSVAENVFDVGLTVQKIIQAVCITAGSALILGSLVVYKKHRKNPIATKLSSSIFMFFVGVCLILLAFIPMQV
jgi:hypothetical protein